MFFGKTLQELFAGQSRFTEEAITQLGKAYQELRILSEKQGIIASENLKSNFLAHADLINNLYDTNSVLKSLGSERIVFSEGKLERLFHQWAEYCQLTGFSLGDVGFTNFIYANKKKIITFIDGNFLGNNVNHLGQPIAILDKDLVMIIHQIYINSISNGKTFLEAKQMVDRFLVQQGPIHPYILFIRKN